MFRRKKKSTATEDSITFECVLCGKEFKRPVFVYRNGGKHGGYSLYAKAQNAKTGHIVEFSIKVKTDDEAVCSKCAVITAGEMLKMSADVPLIYGKDDD